MHQISNAVILGFSDGANIAMRFAMKHPDMVKALILNGGNLNAKGVKRTTQIPIEIGYRIAKHFAGKSQEAKSNAEMLGLMVNVKLIDASPIGINVRSTVATYANVHDELRKIYAKTADAKEKKYKAKDFSYNTGKLRCPVCDGTGQITLDVQFLPDVDVVCPECKGSRYAKEAWETSYENKSGERYSLPRMMEMDVNTALRAANDWKAVRQ